MPSAAAFGFISSSRLKSPGPHSPLPKLNRISIGFTVSKRIDIVACHNLSNVESNVPWKRRLSDGHFRGQGFQILGSLVLSDMSELSLSYGFRTSANVGGAVILF